jgi:hypothetical protein
MEETLAFVSVGKCCIGHSSNAALPMNQRFMTSRDIIAKLFTIHSGAPHVHSVAFILGRRGQ